LKLKTINDHYKSFVSPGLKDIISLSKSIIKTNNMRTIPRRNFLMTLCASALGSAFLKEIQAAGKDKTTVKPIEGSWFEFQHHSAAGSCISLC
jgi:hypothetical protein